jgi:hypothetical protein
MVFCIETSFALKSLECVFDYNNQCITSSPHHQTKAVVVTKASLEFIHWQKLFMANKKTIIDPIHLLFYSYPASYLRTASHSLGEKLSATLTVHSHAKNQLGTLGKLCSKTCATFSRYIDNLNGLE